MNPGGPTDGSQSPGVFQDTPVGKVFAGVLVVLLGAFSVLLVYYFLLVFRGYRRGLRATAGVKAPGASLTSGQRSALVLGLRSSRARLASATDIRGEVLFAYLKMLIALEGRGLGDRPHYTCWDLHRAASRVLGKADAPMAALTSLFEEARYSHHDLTEAHRQGALRAVGEVLASL